MSTEAARLPSDLPARPAPAAWAGQRTRRRIGGGFLALALLLFTAVAAFTGHAAREAAERRSGQLLLALGERLVQALAQDQADRLREIELLAELESLTDEPITPARWRPLLERLQGTLPHYSWIGVTDTEGRVRAATAGLLEGRSVAQRPWFRDALRAPAMGDVHDALLLQSLLPPAADGEPLRLLDFSAPVRREGQLIGVIGAHLSLRAAEERRRAVLASLPPGLQVELLVLDGQGRRVLGPAAPELPSLSPGLLASDGPADWRWGDGETYLTARLVAAPTPGRPALGWTVLARQPVAVAMADGTRQQRAIAVAGAAAALIFGLAGWALAGRFTAPWQRLAAQAAASMPPASARAVPAGDELEQLAQTLGELLAALQQREQALARLNASLESRVADRTGELQRANEDLRAFARSVSHDLRGPLASVSMLLRQLERHEADGTTGSAAATVATPRATLTLLAAECERLAQLCEELLTLAMVEQQDLARQPVELPALVHEIVDELRRGPAGEAARRAQIELGALSALPPLQADPLLLRQVWHNLLANAVKFSGRVQAPRIVVEATAPGAGDGDGWHFVVADNGAGFDPAQAHRLFGVFQRLHRASDFAGTGVGLSIVRRVVHRHGGRVWAESSPGQGARFHFTLAAIGADVPQK